jgi:hypothetical protein
MPRRDGELIGHTSCPECEFDKAEVRKDRNGHPYRKCTCCMPATVYLTRGAPVKVARLLGKTRFVKGARAAPRSQLVHQLAQLHQR